MQNDEIWLILLQMSTAKKLCKESGHGILQFHCGIGWFKFCSNPVLLLQIGSLRVINDHSLKKLTCLFGFFQLPALLFYNSRAISCWLLFKPPCTYAWCLCCIFCICLLIYKKRGRNTVLLIQLIVLLHWAHLCKLRGRLICITLRPSVCGKSIFFFFLKSIVASNN